MSSKGRITKELMESRSMFSTVKRVCCQLVVNDGSFETGSMARNGPGSGDLDTSFSGVGGAAH